MKDFHEELSRLPHKPGVYIMHQGDEILYIGKAVDLHNRVSQYFREGADGRPLIIFMVEKVDYFETIVTDTEMEAFILENNLIKLHKPPYNTLLKDDKRYPYVKVTLSEGFPRVFKTRTVSIHQTKYGKDRYLGPYTNGTALYETLKLMKDLWPLRDCNRNLPADIGKERACLNYHLGRCCGPCAGAISIEDYHKMIEEVITFLEGRDDELKKRLKAEMQEASDAMNFELAAKKRDLINALKQLSESQKLESADPDLDQDIIGIARKEGAPVLVQCFFIRGGKMLGREHFSMENQAGDSDAAILKAFIQQYYSGTATIPPEILVPVEPEDVSLLCDFLTKTTGRKVHIGLPKRGEKAALVRLATQNAELTLSQNATKIENQMKRTKGASDTLFEMLGLTDALETVERIEAYDISNTFGYQSVGSMVVFENGEPRKNSYRKFKIETIVGSDDMHSLYEVLTRRFSHGIAEMKELIAAGKSPSDGSFTHFPQLILMDGGHLQVEAAKQALAELGLEIPIAGMVKDDTHSTRALLYEGEEVSFEGKQDAFHLVTRIQDEAHRFAITFHRSLRAENAIQSVLDEIEGVGPSRRKALLQHFGSVDNLRHATLEEIKNCPQIPEAVAETIYNFFNKKASE